MKAVGYFKDHKTRPAHYLSFYATNDSGEKALYSFALYGGGNNTVFGLSDELIDYQIPRELYDSIMSFIQKLESTSAVSITGEKKISE